MPRGGFVRIPREGKMKVLSFSVRPEVAEALDVAAAERGLSRNQYMRQLFERWFSYVLARPEPPPEPKGFLERFFS